MRVLSLLLGLLFVGVSNVWAQSEGVSRVLTIPLPNKVHSIKKPSSDLLKEGQLLDAGEAAKMEENGFDLSTLDPKPEKMWQDKTYPTSDRDSRGFPKAEIGVKFGSQEANTKFTTMVRVQSNENKNFYFRLALSRFAQPMMMRAALLRKLGYFIPSPKSYNNLKVTFKDEAEKKKFLTQAQQDMGTDFESRKWISEDNTSQHFIVLASASLEFTSADYFDLNWGLAPNPDDRATAGLVGLFSHNRTYRALIFPYAITDVPESVNRFSTELGSIQTGFATISYFMAQSFQACDYTDAQWLLKRLQKLTLKDYQEIVAEAHYPPEIDSLVLAKLVNRANSAISLFGLKPTVANLTVDFTSPSGLVTHGKVTQEFVPGWPQRFAHGERTSPYQEGDMARYLMMEGKSTLVASVAARLNQNLQISTTSDAAAKAQQDYRDRIIDHIRNHPNEPFTQKVTSWGGPVSGFNVNASRHIGTGTYSGSTAPVQLVDDLSVSAGYGIFRALDGLPKYMPILGANVSVVRDYIHVRPILSIQEAKTVSWKNLVIPTFMKGLSEILRSMDKKNDDGSIQKSLDVFLNDLRDGEVFTISDSIALSEYLQASSSFDVLMGLQPFSFLNSITGGVDSSRVTVRQVSFVRVVNDRFNGVQVYVRELKNKANGVEVNLNYYFNFLKARAQNVEGDIVSNGYLIDYNPALTADTDPESDAGKKLDEVRTNLRLALLPLFRDNDTELLDGKFKNKKFVVNTDIQGREQKLKFLAWKFASFKEDRHINIEYPPSEKHPELNPKDEIVSLFSSRRGELKGRDLLGFFMDFVDGIFTNETKGKLTTSRGMGDNPANAPMGNAYWRVINTEADISAKITPQLNSVATIQHVWGGWSLSRDKFFKVIDDIKKQFENTSLANYELINKGQFINVKSLDFYRITANLSVLGDGLNKIRDLILQPAANSKNPTESNFPLERLMKKIRGDKKNPETFRYANEKEMYSELMKLLGNDDQQAGYQAYLQACKAHLQRGPRDNLGTSTQQYNSNLYPCLSSWVRRLMEMGSRYPQDKTSQTKWMSEVLYILDEQIPMPQLLKYLGEENYIFLVRINGFRSGDEDGDQEFFSKTLGDPNQNFPEAGGLINLYIKKTGLMPTELDRTMVGFQ